MNQTEERKYASLMVRAYEWLMEFHSEHTEFTFTFKKGGEHLFCGRGGKERPAGNKFYVNLRPNGANRNRTSPNGSGHWFELDFFADSGFTSISEVKCNVMSDDSHVRYKKFLQEVFNVKDTKMKCITIAGGDGSSEDDVKKQLLEWLDKNYEVLVGALKDDSLPGATFEERRSKCIKALCEKGVLLENDGQLSIPDDAQFSRQDEDDEENDGGEEQKDYNVGDENSPDADTNIGSRNLIVFGAPGTGKSFELEENRKNQFPKNYERVTFYPTYSYAQFVGTYKPVMKPIIGNDGKEELDAKGNVKEDISYDFVPGPFLRMLVKALNEPEKNWCLIIEEINRANAAAVFGDVFQLLDRGSDGDSEYAIAASEDIKKHLKKKLDDNGKSKLTKLTGSQVDSDGDVNLKIPRNMYIWATMNSADQGVFPMDTAFKRRWEFEYIGVDDEAKESGAKCLEWTIEGCNYKWNQVRRVINGLLAVNGVNEDKLMGPYFIQPATKEETSITLGAFSSKVLMYLWEDAGRMIRRKLFGDEINTYSKLVKKWSEGKVGIRVFEDAVKRDKDKLDKQDKDIRNCYNDLVGKSGDSGGSST